jgi:hypothetical protein
MATSNSAGPSRAVFVLRFQSLFSPGRALAFPCGPTGEVDIDSLSEQAKCSYLGARALIGRDFAYPVVRRVNRGGLP